MNEGVKILLNRMDSNPEEFEQDGKWVSMFNNFKKYMAEEEKTAFLNKLNVIRMEQFKNNVLKKLLEDKQPKHNPKDYTDALAYSMMQTKEVLTARMNELLWGETEITK